MNASEIKFRGKDRRGNWLVGDLFHIGSSKILIAPSDGDWHDFVPLKNNPMRFPNDGKYQVDENTVGRFTGLHDADGKEIWEGDITELTIPDGSLRRFKVVFGRTERTCKPLRDFEDAPWPIEVNGWCFDWEGHTLIPSVIDGIPDYMRMRVVGNVHDNPELLFAGHGED